MTRPDTLVRLIVASAPGRRIRWAAGRLCTVAVLLAPPGALATNPYAATLIAQNGHYGAAPYDNPAAVLGEPTRIAVNNDPLIGDSPYRSSIVQGVYNADSQDNAFVTTLSASGGSYGSITVRFDQPVTDDPANPYGIDLNVFGNSFYVGAGTVSDTTDMRTHYLLGGLFAEPVVVSVSPDNLQWYTYSGGPHGDTAFPTQGKHWDPNQHDASGNGWTDMDTDFTKPVNPTLQGLLGGGGLTAHQAMNAYVGAGGGTGFDLAESPYSAIQYVRVASAAGMVGGEIDALADVRPAYLGEALSVTPTNLQDGTPLYFQDSTDASRNLVKASFTTLNNHAKLSTAPLSNPEALAALAGRDVLAGYELAVTSLLAASSLSLQVDWDLSTGPMPLGDDAHLEVVAWDGLAWAPVAASINATGSRITLVDWTDPMATLAVTRLTGDYNTDGAVDARDYAVWREGLGVHYGEDGFARWLHNYGARLPAPPASPPGATPTPGAVCLLLTAIAWCSHTATRRPRRDQTRA